MNIARSALSFGSGPLGVPLVGPHLSISSAKRPSGGTRARGGATVTLLLELGVPPHVQALARYADVDITFKIYAHTNLDAMREAVKRLNDLLG